MTKLLMVFFNEAHQHAIDFIVETLLHVDKSAANADGRQVEFQDEVLVAPGRRMLANVERAEQIVEVVGGMNIVVFAEHVQES